ASEWWLADADGDGRRDLLARVGTQVKAALSRGTYFEDVGVWTGPAPHEASTVSDVNDDNHYDILSISPEGHLTVGISNGSAIVATIDMPNVWCAGIGDCLIGDVTGDGHPDLIEVMRYATGTDRAGDVWVSLGTEVPGFPALPDPPTSPDTDHDGVADRDRACTPAPGPAQRDSDGDGYGTACDADLDQDGTVAGSDQQEWVACWAAGLPARPD